MVQDFCPLKTKTLCSISCQISSELKQNSPLHFSIFLIHHVYVTLIEYIRFSNTQRLPRQKSRPLVIHDAESPPCPASKLGRYLIARSTLLDREGMEQRSGDASLETSPDRGPWKKYVQRQDSYQPASLFFPSCQAGRDLASGSSLPSLKQPPQIETQNYDYNIYNGNRWCLIMANIDIKHSHLRLCQLAPNNKSHQQK